MTVKHHPSETLLLAYAAGHLSEALSLVVAAHLTYCPDCRDIVAEAEAMGGALLDDSPPARMGGDALAAVLARLTTAEAAAPPRREAPRGAASGGGLRLPAPVLDYVGGDPAHARWQWVGPGIRQLDLVANGRTRDAARLLRLSPGRVMPHHSHTGLELTVVLHGAYTDEQGRFARGDMAELDGAVEHQPIAEAGDECVCLVATDAPLRFHGLLPRMVAPMMGF